MGISCPPPPHARCSPSSSGSPCSPAAVAGGPGPTTPPERHPRTHGHRNALRPHARARAHWLRADLVSDDQPAKKGLERQVARRLHVQDEVRPRHRRRVLHRELRTASSIASLDKEAYAGRHHRHARSDDRRNSPTRTTPGQSTAPPWDETAPAIDLSCQAKTADGPDGYAYGVYICSPKGNQRSIDAMQACSTPCPLAGPDRTPLRIRAPVPGRIPGRPPFAKSRTGTIHCRQHRQQAQGDPMSPRREIAAARAPGRQHRARDRTGRRRSAPGGRRRITVASGDGIGQVSSSRSLSRSAPSPRGSYECPSSSNPYAANPAAVPSKVKSTSAGMKRSR